MSQDWEIKPRSSSCQECQTPFAEGQRYSSTLVFCQEGYVRGDYCETCWTTKSTSLSPYSSWRGTYKTPPVQEEVLKKETAESLLRRLMEETNDARRNAIYILAVMLERKKILAEKDVRKNEDGSLTRIYEHRKTGETFLVPDPQLQLDQLGPVQQEVAEMLGGGPKPPAQPAAEGAAPEAEPAADEEPEEDEDDEDDDEEEDEEDK
jgi:hypothetical protein